MPTNDQGNPKTEIRTTKEQKPALFRHWVFIIRHSLGIGVIRHWWSIGIPG